MANLLPIRSAEGHRTARNRSLQKSSESITFCIATADFTLPKNRNNGYTVHPTLTIKGSERPVIRLSCAFFLFDLSKKPRQPCVLERLRRASLLAHTPAVTRGCNICAVFIGYRPLGGGSAHVQGVSASLTCCGTRCLGSQSDSGREASSRPCPGPPHGLAMLRTR